MFARRNRWLALLSLITVCIGCSCDRTRSESSSEDLDSQAAGREYVWGGPKNISILPIIAQSQGYFRDAGVSTKPRYVQTGKIAMDALVSGDLDFGVIVETNVAFVGFQKGAGIEVIARIMTKYDDAVVARRDLGIETPKDLEGHTVGILRATTSHRFMDLFIDYHGLDRDKIKIVNLSPPGIQAAVLNGELAAGSLWEPFRYNVEKQLGKDKIVQFNDRKIYAAYALVAARSQLIQENPDAVRRFLMGLLEAEKFVRTDTEAAIDMVAPVIGIEGEVLRQYWDQYELQVDLEDDVLESLKAEGSWIRQRQKGFAQKPLPDYSGYINRSLLDSVLSP